MARRLRTMSDDEIALTKAMLRRGLKNDAVHFYFNLPDRLISPGRITQIKQGKYGATVAEASQDELDAFLNVWDIRISGRGHHSRIECISGKIRRL